MVEGAGAHCIQGRGIHFHTEWLFGSEKVIEILITLVEPYANTQGWEIAQQRQAYEVRTPREHAPSRVVRACIILMTMML